MEKKTSNNKGENKKGKIMEQKRAKENNSGAAQKATRFFSPLAGSTKLTSKLSKAWKFKPLSLWNPFLALIFLSSAELIEIFKKETSHSPSLFLLDTAFKSMFGGEKVFQKEKFLRLE